MPVRLETNPLEPNAPGKSRSIFNTPRLHWRRQQLTVLHSGMTVGRFFGTHAMGAVFPLAAGILVYGWRALGVLVVILTTATIATAVWRRIGVRGNQLHYAHVFWLATLLTLMLPPQLFSSSVPWNPGALLLWPMLPGAAILLVIFMWMLGGVGSSRIHPALLTVLMLVVVSHDILAPHTIVQPRKLFFGDVLDARPDRTSTPREIWASGTGVPGQDAEWRESAAQRLIFYTSGNERPERQSLSLEDLLRDRMPPLEDLIVAGQPGPIASASAIAVIVGGLFLLYHGLIDFRIPLFVFMAAFIALLILPVPVVITEAAKEWRWFAFREPGVGWAAAVTFVNYELLAGPLPLVAFFLATSPAIRPMYRRGRALYAILLGIAVAIFQLYVDVATGPYVALLALSLLTPAMDRWFSAKPLV